MKVRSNLTGGIIFVIFGTLLLLLLEAQVITYGQIPFLQSAKVLPFMAELVMIAGGLFLTLQSLVFKKETVVEIRWEEQKFALIVLGIFAVFASLIFFAGYIVGSVVFVLLMSRLYRNRNLLEVALLAVLAVGIFILFTQVFYVQLPAFWRN